MSYVEATSTHAVIYLEWDQVHSTRVALAPCTCRATKSNSTQEVRERLSKALAFAETKRAGSGSVRHQPKE